MSDSQDLLLLQLSEAVECAFRQAVTQAWLAHAGERFYAFILYVTPLIESIAACFNTEEALARAARSPIQRNELRWLPSDWPYNWEGEGHFQPANDLLKVLTERDGYGDAARAKRWNALMRALKALDGQGLFGTGADREFVLVNIMWGDRDCCAHVESARKLNPFHGYLRYAEYELPCLYQTETEIAESRSNYKEESLARIRKTIRQVEADLAPRK